MERPDVIDTLPLADGGETPFAAAILQRASGGFIFVDEEGTIAFINETVERILRVRREEVVGKRVDMLPLRVPLYKVLSEESHEHPVEVSINGSILLIRSTRLATGAVAGDLVEIRDISEEKRERRQREEFVAMMTHDLKSPLTVMMGYIQAMKCGMVGPLDDGVNACVDELDGCSYRLLGMIEDVLDAYRLEVGLLSINRADCNLRDILTGCYRDLSREAQSKGIECTCSIPEELPTMHMDKKQMARVFANLLSNAVKFTPPGGTISFDAALEGKHVTVAVSDTGIGISSRDIGKIFNKYFRATTVAGFKGTGLGLAISKAIVDAHRGEITVQSQEGEGSRFTVTLPLL